MRSVDLALDPESEGPRCNNGKRKKCKLCKTLWMAIYLDPDLTKSLGSGTGRFVSVSEYTALAIFF